MATPTDVLGSRIVRELLNYNATTGTWTCTKGSGNAVQGTSANRPSAGTTPSGQSCPDFVGAATPNNDFLSPPIISSLPTYSTSHNRLFACVFYLDVIGPDGANIIWRGNDTYGITFDGRVEACGAYSNSAVSLNAWHTLIIRKNGTGAVVMTLDGVDQTTTGTGALGHEWKTDGGQVIGGRGNGDYWFDGRIDSMIFGYSTTTAFTSGEATALHAALAEHLAAGGGGGPVSIAVGSAGVASTAAALSVSRRLSALASAAGSAIVATKVARRVAASASGVATTSVAARRSRGLSASASGAASSSVAIVCRRSARPTASGVAVVTSSLRVARALAANAPGVASTAGAVRVQRRLAATSSGQAAAVATIRVDRRLVSVAAGVGSASVAISVEGVDEVLFAPMAAGSATAAAAIIVARRMGATASGSAVVAPVAMRVQRRLVASSSASGGGSAAASVVRGVVVTSAGFATAIAALTVGDEGSAVPGGHSVTAVAFVVSASVLVVPVSSQAVVIVDGAERSLPVTTTIKRNDREPPFRAKLFQDGDAAALAGASVRFLMKLEGAMPSSPAKVSSLATVEDAAAGIVRYDWAAGDTDAPGSYRAELEVTYANGKTRTFPNEGYLAIRVVGDLG